MRLEKWLQKRLLSQLTGAGVWKGTARLFPGLCLLLGGSVLTADQLLKASIERQPDESFPRDVPGTAGAARYEKCHNDGFVLGAMRQEQNLVRFLPALFTAVLTGKLAEMLFHGRGRYGEKLGLTLVVSGALSNVYDRFTRGYVVDFLSIKKGFLGKIVINLGDMAIFAGSVIVFFSRGLRAILKKD